MTNDQMVTPEIQAAISTVYQQGFEAGRRKGYEEGIVAAQKQLSRLSAVMPSDPESPELQEANASLPLSTRIEDLQFALRTYNVLKREGLHTIGDVLAWSEEQLLDVRNMGGRSMDEIIEKFAAVGYTVRKG